MGTMIDTMKAVWDQGMKIPAPTLTEKNMPDQTGKVTIITGSNTGVGYEVAKILYAANATVYLAARSQEKTDAAIEKIKAAHPASKGALHYLKLDLSDLPSIKASAQQFLAAESKLHWLDNNAGVMVPPAGSKTPQGHDLQYGTNILGPFLFTKLLEPVLKATAAAEPAPGNVRVSWAGSVAVYVFAPKNGVTFDDAGSPKVLGNEATYGTSKAANYFLAAEFGKRSGAADNVLHLSYNPGNLKSDLYRHMEAERGGLAQKVVNMGLFPVVYGAYTELYSGVDPSLTLEDQGSFIAPWGRKRPVRRDVEKATAPGGAAEKLWQWCERETAQYA